MAECGDRVMAVDSGLMTEEGNLVEQGRRGMIVGRQGDGRMVVSWDPQGYSIEYSQVESGSVAVTNVRGGRQGTPVSQRSR